MFSVFKKRGFYAPNIKKCTYCWVNIKRIHKQDNFILSDREAMN